MKASARTAGLLYLAMGVCTGVGMGYVDPRLYVPGDPALTLERLGTSASLARLGFGRLVFSSGMLPKGLGVLLVLGGAGYLVNCAVHFFAPSLRPLTTPALLVAVLAEVSTIAWLLTLTRGVRTAP